MKVLITGSSGLIGRWVAERLKKEGHQTIGLDKNPSPVPNIDEQVTCDILDQPALVSEVRRIAPNALIHLAARIDLNEGRNLNGYAANIDGVRNVIRAVKETPGIHRAIYTSSQLVCRVGYVPASDTEYCPDTLYGKSKVFTEKVVREENGGGADWCIVRPTTVWGPGMSSHYQNLLRLICRGQYFHCGFGKLFKSYSYAGNIAFQYLKILLAPSEKIHRQMFYLADYDPISLRNYTNELARAMNAPSIPTIPLPIAKSLALIGDGLNAIGLKKLPLNSFRLRNILTEYQFDMSKTRDICGGLPFSFEEGVKATAEWYLEYITR